MWRDIDAREYQARKLDLERQRQTVLSWLTPQEAPNLDRAAQLLQDMPSLWKYPGVTDQQRQELLREVFEGIYIQGKNITAIQPRNQYAPLFAPIMSLPRRLSVL